MDFIALNNLSGYVRVGDPKNNLQRKYSSSAILGMEDNPLINSDVLGVSSVNMKTQTSAALPAKEKSILFSDILRAACDRKLNSSV